MMRGLGPFAAVAAGCVAAGCTTSPRGETPVYADLSTAAEALRREQTSLEGSCDEGFAAFSAAASGIVRGVAGGERLADAAAAHGAEPLSPEQLEEPGLTRLLVDRYVALCLAPFAEELRSAVDDLDALEGGDGRVGLAGVLAEAVDGASPLVVQSEPCSVDESITEVSIAGADEEQPVDLLATLVPRAGDGAPGPAQVAAGVAALRGLADSGLVPAHPIRLRVLPRPSGSCEPRLVGAVQGTAATVALDGGAPLVLARYGRIRWALSVPHRRPSDAWLALARRRDSAIRARGGPPPAPLVVDAGEEEPAGGGPGAAWALVVDTAADSGTEPSLEVRLRQTAATTEAGRVGARIEVERRDEGCIVRARPRPDSASVGGETALSDLAALVTSAGATDPPGGGAAALLRAVARLAGDPAGRRLGLHYTGPGGNEPVIAPRTLATTESQATIELEIFRPPGMSQAAFGARLDDARLRLSNVADRLLVESGRQEVRPTEAEEGVATAAVERTVASLTGENIAPQTEAGLGLSSAVDGIVTVGLPPFDGPVGPSPPELVADLVFNLAVAVDDEIRRRSTWQ